MIVQFSNAVKRYREIILDEIAQNTPATCWIAGGALRDYFNGIKIDTDYDMFFPSQEDFNEVMVWMEDNGGKVIWESENGKKIRYKKRTYDLVKKYFPTPQATIDNFDFTVCMMAVDRMNFYHHPTAFIDLAKKQLMVANLTYPASTMKRVLKYYQKGYKICNEELAKIVIAIRNTPIEESISNGPEERTSGGSNRLFIGID